MAREYKDQILDTSVNTKRVYNIVDSDGNIVAENISFDDKTVYSQEGTEFGAQEVNEIYEAIDEVNSSLELDYSKSKLPETTDINTFLQSILEKLYPLQQMIYNAGNQYTDITGGWIQHPYGYSTSWTHNKPTFASDYIQLTTSVTSSDCVAVTANKIDLTDFDSIVVEFSNEYTAGEFPEIALVKSLNTQISDNYDLFYNVPIGVTKHSIDISSYSGEYYIVVMASNKRVGKIYKMYLE